MRPARIKMSESRKKQARKRGPYGRKKIERDASIQIPEKLFKEIYLVDWGSRVPCQNELLLFSLVPSPPKQVIQHFWQFLSSPK